ncbi:hypothetical protein HHL11_12615 [Ramlibacter sp. G-1-2-2]|uniref:Uncharacterized protein n=1 Tax=Ramlibacter agri TaxID=2728837 RepID=A0A848H4Z7_9BURK|nr:hypothetical protein [Ramlibacter agri]NML44601.1 hypothetical protein [Ramlibacter agri]
MNTQAQVQRLQAGESLPQSRFGAGPAILAEGELLVQAPAEWLAGTVVIPSPVRIVAPAVLGDLPPNASVMAVGTAKVVVPQPAPLFPIAKWFRSANFLARSANSPV